MAKEKITKAKINLKTGEFEFEGSEKFVESKLQDIKQFLNNWNGKQIENTNVQEETKPIITNQNLAGKTLSIKEFILEKNPKSDPQRATVIAYYLENYEKMNVWQTKDIIKGFKNAKEPVPGNPSEVINKCKGKGEVMDAEGGFTLTSTGEKKVKEGFSKFKSQKKSKKKESGKENKNNVIKKSKNSSGRHVAGIKRLLEKGEFFKKPKTVKETKDELEVLTFYSTIENVSAYLNYLVSREILGRRKNTKNNWEFFKK